MKTQKSNASVKSFLDAIEDDQKRADAKALDRLLQRATGKKPKMWGNAIIGYGDSTLTYASGREVEWMALGFSPRAASLTLYLNDLPALASLLKKPSALTRRRRHVSTSSASPTSNAERAGSDCEEGLFGGVATPPTVWTFCRSALR